MFLTLSIIICFTIEVIVCGGVILDCITLRGVSDILPPSCKDKKYTLHHISDDASNKLNVILFEK